MEQYVVNFASSAAQPTPPDDSRDTPPRRYAHIDGLYWGSPETVSAVAPGFYTPADYRGMPALRKSSITVDNLLRLPDPVCDMLLNEFCTFWDRMQGFSARGLTAKRGILLYGPPGSGKTSAVQLMCHHMIENMRGIVLFVTHPGMTAQSLQLFRALEPVRPAILVYEDLDAMVQRYSEMEILALLDGELQVGNVVNVATTNYPEDLDRRFTDRPGRFDRIALVDMPSAEARAAYFAAKAPEVPEPRRAQWVIASGGWSIAHLRELVVAHLELGEPDSAVIARLSNMREQLPKSEDGDSLRPSRNVGFGDARARRNGMMR